MYLSLPKHPCDVRTPVAPEEKNIVDMPAMDLCFLFSSHFIEFFIFLANVGNAALERPSSNHHVVYSMQLCSRIISCKIIYCMDTFLQQIFIMFLFLTLYFHAFLQDLK